MKNFTKISRIIFNLGGTGRVARKLNVLPSTVSNWKNESAVKAGNILVSANKKIHKKFLKILKPITN